MRIPGWVRAAGSSFSRMGLALLGLLLAGCAAAASQARAPVPHATAGTRVLSVPPATLAQCPWMNTALPVSQRVQMVLARMTLAEKIQMMYGTPPGQNPGGYEGYIPGNARLCIPPLTEEDGPLGVANVGGVTALPSAEALAATWSRQAAQEYGAINGREHWAKGMEVVLGPTINILRTPLWGRAFETLGEDPYLTAQMATAEVQGIQAQGVIAQAKHLAAYNQEADRGSVNVVVSERALQEIYLPAFRAVIRQGQVGSLMCAYPQTNGAYDCANPVLIHDIVDTRWGFLGWVGSDYGATHSTVGSANAGLGQEMGDGGAFFGNGLLAQAVSQGQVATATINRAVAGTLYEMFRFGLFNRQPTGTTATPAATPTDTAEAETLAAEGTVLLKNAAHVLPLRPQALRTIAVIGADASAGAMAVSPPPSSAHVQTPFVVTPLAAITAALVPAGRLVANARVLYADGTSVTQAAQVAAQAQVAVVFADDVETEGTDRTSLALPGNQDALITAVAQANPHTVVVLNTGGAVLMPWLGQVQAVLEAWYPGESDGKAIASVLFGQTDPGGHLPMTFPASAIQTPLSPPAGYPGVNGVVTYSEGLQVGYRWYETHRVQPLFPFGFGLSYTTFAFRDLSVAPSRMAAAGAAVATCTPSSGLWARLFGAAANSCLARVSVTVTNTGHVSGSDVVQLYLGDPPSTGEPPRQLKGFERVTLAPGQSRRVVLEISPRDAAYWNSAVGAFLVAPGTYTVYVGDASTRSELPLSADFRVPRSTGPQPVTVRVPATLRAPATTQVTATLHNGSGTRDHQVTLSLRVGTAGAPAPESTAPSAFVIRALCGPEAQATTAAVCSPAASLAPGQALTARWEVSLPPGTEPGTYHFDVSAHYRTAQGSLAGTGTAAATVHGCCTLTATAADVMLLAEHTLAVSIRFENQSTSAGVADLRLGLTAPAGYQVIPPAAVPTTVTATGTAAGTFTVTAPATAPGGPVLLEASASFLMAGQSLKVSQPLTVEVPYPSLAAAYDNVGVSVATATTAGNFDGQHDSYSASALAAAGLIPGHPVPGLNTLFWPNRAPGQPDNVIASGQVVALAGRGSALVVVGAGDFANIPSLPVPGSASGQGRIIYADGTQQPFTLDLADWYNNAPGPGQVLVTTTAHWNQPGGPGSSPVSVYAATVPLRPGREVAYVVLPDVSQGVASNETAMHIFAMGIR